MDIMNQEIKDRYAIYNGDSCQLINSIPDESIHFSIFSPPFADLYCYSNNDADLGNCKDYDTFFEHFSFIVSGLKRIMKKGRIVAVHCMDIPAMKERDGYIGIKDFSGDIIRLFQKHGFVYHSRTTIWKDPLIEATRTKALGLMHKQLCKDSIRSRCGLPDYIVAFRNDGENEIPITHDDGLNEYAGSDIIPQGVRSHNIWRAYASPVWMDIRQTNTLNARSARDEDDEKHVCPLQLDTITRCIQLWSNPNETVFTPFMGVGSEVYGAVVNGRKGIGFELKESYYRQAVKNLAIASGAQNGELFTGETK
jgi:DNA modification methylase